MLKVVILAMCFEGDITFNLRNKRIKGQSIFKRVYRLLNRLTTDQFVDMVLRTVNAVCEKRKSGKTIIIGDTTNLTVDINRFRKKYKSERVKI